MLVCLIRVSNTLYKQATRRVQRIMQNVYDAMDYVSIPNTDVRYLGTIVEGLVEQPEVESVQLAKLPQDITGYEYTIRYKGFDTAKTTITLSFSLEPGYAEEEEHSLIDQIIFDLSHADLMEIVAHRIHLADKEDNHGTDTKE